MSQREPKGCQKNAKDAKSEPKDAKRKWKGDQNGSKNRLGRQGRFWKQKGSVAREFLGGIFGQFFEQKVDTNSMQ